jgi:hypothetical protein
MSSIKRGSILMMQFIILGIVPGTDIQIGYDSLTRFLAVVALFYLASLLLKEKRFDSEKAQDFISQTAI